MKIQMTLNGEPIGPARTADTIAALAREVRAIRTSEGTHKGLRVTLTPSEAETHGAWEGYNGECMIEAGDEGVLPVWVEDAP